MNSPSSPVLEAERRAWQYWFADGLTNLFLGVTNLLFAFCMLYTPREPTVLSVSNVLPVAAWIVVLGLYVLLSLRHREVVEWLKTKITYPRTGYVRPPFLAGCATLDSEGRKKMAFLIALSVLAAVGMIILKNRWVYTVAGVIFAGALWTVRKNQRISWMVLAGFPLIGLCVSIFVVPRVAGSRRLAYFLAGWGVLFLLDGAITLVRYIRRNPVPRGSEA